MMPVSEVFRDQGILFLEIIVLCFQLIPRIFYKFCIKFNSYEKDFKL